LKQAASTATLPPPLAVASVAAPFGAASPLARARFLRDLLRYGLCSALALALDWSVLVGLVHAGVSPLLAAPIAFSLGMGVTYGLSVAVVYADRRREAPLREAIVFLAIGVAGLGVNQLVLWVLVSRLGLAAAIAKAPAAGVVFTFNFLLRRAALFSRPGP
jgi:putative flippase GtrA